MAQRLNKKLIAGLTLAGMAITTAAAIVMVMSLPQQDPTKAFEQAEEAYARGDHVTARRWYVQAYQRAAAGGRASDEANEYLIRAGDMALASGNVRDAVGTWYQVMLNNPHNATAQQRIVELFLEMARMGSLPWSQLETEAEKLLAISSQNHAGMHALGLALINQRAVNERNLTRGRELLSEAFDGDKSSPEFATTLALHYLQEGETDRGRAVFDELMANLPEDPAQAAKAWRERASFFLLTYIQDRESYNQRRHQRVSQTELNALLERIRHSEEEMESCIDAALELDADNVDTFLTMGRIWASRRSTVEDEAERERQDRSNFARAEDFFKRAIHAEPDGYDGYLYLSQLHLRRGNLEEASQVLSARLERPARRDGILGGQSAWYMARIRNELFRVSMQEASAYAAAGGQMADDATFQTLLARMERLHRDQVADLRAEDPSALFMQGRLRILQGDVAGAIRSLEHANRLLPTPNPEIHQYLAQLYIRIGELGPAEQTLRTVLEAHPASPGAWASHANLMLRLDRHEAALQSTEQLLRLEPNSPRALAIQLAVYRAQQNWAAMREVQQRLSALQADATLDKLQQAVMSRLEAESGSSDSEALLASSERLLRDILQNDPTNMVALRELTLMLGRDEQRYDDLRAFLSEHEQIITHRLEDDSGEPLTDEQKTNYANVLTLIDRLQIVATPGVDAKEKFAQLEEIIKLGEDPFLVAAQLFQLYSRLPDKQEEAFAQLIKANELQPDQPRIVETLFSLSLQHERWDLAEQMLNKAIQLGLDPSGGHFYRGRMLVARTDIPNHHERAIAEIQSGLREFPTYSEGHTMLGRVLGHIERFEEAKQSFRRALELNPRSGQAALGLATLAAREEDQASKERYLHIAARTIPNHPWVRAELQVLQDQRDPQAGIERREQIRRANPNDLNNLLRLADLYIRLDQFEKAREVYEAARQVDEENLPLLQEYVNFLRHKSPPEPETATRVIEEVLEKIVDREPIYRATAQLVLASHLNVLRQMNFPGAPDLQACDEAYEMAAEISEEPAIRMDIGSYYKDFGRFDKAEHWFRDAVAMAERNENAAAERRSRRYLIDTLIQMQDPRREEDVLKELTIFRQKYDDPFVLLAESEYHAMTGRLNQALEAINRFLRQQPNSAVGHFRRADIRFQQSLWEPALEDYRAARAIEPDGFFWEHRVRLALCHERLRDNDLAIAELISVLNAEPKQWSALNELLRIYRRLGRWNQAEQLLTQRRNEDPENIRWLHELHQIYMASDNASKAIEMAERIVELREGAEDAVEMLLHTYLDFDRPDDAIRFIQTRIPAERHNELWILMPIAAAHAQKGETSQALQYYNQALDTLTDQLQAFVTTSNTVKIDMGPQATMQLIRARLARRANERGSRFMLGQLQKEAGDSTAFVNILEELLASIPEGDDFRVLSERLFLLRNLAIERQMLGQYDAARTRYEEMLAIDPYNIVALNNLAFLLMDHFEDPQAALPYSRAAVALAPNDPSVLDTVGWNLVLVGHHDQGIAALRRSIGINDGMAIVHYHVARALVLRSENNPETRDADLREAAAECRRAHELIQASGKDEYNIFDQVVELGRTLGLSLDPRLRTGLASG